MVNVPSPGMVKVWMVPEAPVLLVGVNVFLLVTHLPDTQMRPPEQTVPHVPQFELSLLRSLQVPEQSTAGAAQVQLPLTHDWKVVHLVVQTPQ